MLKAEGRMEIANNISISVTTTNIQKQSK